MGSSVITQNESSPAEVFLFETGLKCINFDETSSNDNFSKLYLLVFITQS